MVRNDAHETRAALDERKAALLSEITEAVKDEDLAKARIFAAVDDLRVLKLATWEEIGEAVGIKGQAAYQRYGKRRPGSSPAS